MPSSRATPSATQTVSTAHLRRQRELVRVAGLDEVKDHVPGNSKDELAVLVGMIWFRLLLSVGSCADVISPLAITLRRTSRSPGEHREEQRIVSPGVENNGRAARIASVACCSHSPAFGKAEPSA